MPRRRLGRSNLEVSEIGVGCWAIGGPDSNLGFEMGWSGTDDRASRAGLERAFELGANHFDTADVYGHGHSERLIGHLVRQVPRDRIVLGTKVGYFSGTAPNAYHPAHMRHQLEMSLCNLATEYVDLYYLHNFNFGDDDSFLEGAIEAIHAFKREGKICAIGMRGPHRYALHRYLNIDGNLDKYERFLAIAEMVDPDVIQVRYNMFTPSYDSADRDIFSWAERRDVGIVINKPLSQGLLLDKYDPAAAPVFAEGDHRQRKMWFQADGLRVIRRRLKPIRERFGSETGDLARVALQYCLHRSAKACVVAGFKSPEQVGMNLRAAGRPLSDEDVRFIEDAMEDIGGEIGEFFARGTRK